MKTRTLCGQSFQWIAVLLLALAVSLPAGAQQSAYRYTLPSGWTRSIEGDVETLTPNGEPTGTVQVILLAPKPLAQDFAVQFDAERTTLESNWGLSAPQPVSPQRGSTKAGPYAAYFASYASEGGDRYMSFLALGRQGGFSMTVFVAANDEAFNRVAPQVTQLWQTLQFAAPGR